MYIHIYICNIRTDHYRSIIDGWLRQTNVTGGQSHARAKPHARHCPRHCARHCPWHGRRHAWHTWGGHAHHLLEPGKPQSPPSPRRPKTWKNLPSLQWSMCISINLSDCLSVSLSIYPQAAIWIHAWAYVWCTSLFISQGFNGASDPTRTFSPCTKSRALDVLHWTPSTAAAATATTAASLIAGLLFSSHGVVAWPPVGRGNPLSPGRAPVRSRPQKPKGPKSPGGMIP